METEVKTRAEVAHGAGNDKGGYAQQQGGMTYQQPGAAPQY